MGPYVLGIDGTKTGWVAVVLDVNTMALSLEALPTISKIDRLPKPLLAVGIDIPIGLLGVVQPGGRNCDKLARTLLAPRGATVFPAPPRPVVQAIAGGATHAQANTMMVGLGAKVGLSLQAFSFAPKIAEVDAFITPQLQNTVREVHPELSFLQMTGGPLLTSKKTLAGRADRLGALAGVGLGGAAGLLAAPLPAGARSDDVLDACAAAWSALRMKDNAASCHPLAPPVDARGLRMEIVA